jgi:hypothetical protein
MDAWELLLVIGIIGIVVMLGLYQYETQATTTAPENVGINTTVTVNKTSAPQENVSKNYSILINQNMGVNAS